MNNWSKRKLLIVVISIIVLGVAADQITKFIFENIRQTLPIYLFGSVGFVWGENFGGAWSILAGRSVIFFVITLLGLPLFAFLLYLARKKSPAGIAGFALIISGTLGNAADRLFRGQSFYSGGVRDFLSIGSWFPIFNIADICLTTGVALVILSMIFFDDDAVLSRKRKQKLTDAAKEGGAEGLGQEPPAGEND